MIRAQVQKIREKEHSVASMHKTIIDITYFWHAIFLTHTNSQSTYPHDDQDPFTVYIPLLDKSEVLFFGACAKHKFDGKCWVLAYRSLLHLAKNWKEWRESGIYSFYWCCMSSIICTLRCPQITVVNYFIFYRVVQNSQRIPVCCFCWRDITALTF